MIVSLALSPAQGHGPLSYTARWPTAILVVVLAALMAVATPAKADFAEAAALREGTMRKLAFHDAPRAVPQAQMLDAQDRPFQLSEWQGKWVVLNFWATWCAPCRHEMPALDNLEAQLGGARFAVLPVATGRNPVPAITRFYDETELTHLPILRDPTQAMSRAMGVLGLPVTIILDPDGREVARMTGDAEWDSPSAIAILNTLIGPAE